MISATTDQGNEPFLRPQATCVCNAHYALLEKNRKPDKLVTITEEGGWHSSN